MTGRSIIDEDAKKTALRMIPYGMYVLTSSSKDGQDVGAATVNWLTQTSLCPPLVAVGVKGDSGAHAQITDTGVFAVNVIGKDQLDLAFNFFKTHEREGDSIGGQAFVAGSAGFPCLPVYKGGVRVCRAQIKAGRK